MKGFRYVEKSGYKSISGKRGEPSVHWPAQCLKLPVILGSGLGDYAACAENAVVIPYSEIPHFPVSTVSYQKGEMIIGEIGGRRVLLMNGRFHYYEGWEMWETAYPVGVFSLLGFKK